MIVIRSLIFQTIHLISILFAGPAAMLTFPFPVRTRFALIRSWARLNLWLVKVICGLNYRVTGSENITDVPGIILCKHSSTWETLALQAVFPDQAWVLKQELLKVPFFGWGLRMLQPIAIDRSAGRKAVDQIAKQGEEKLKQGRWLVIFPEGTRVPAGEVGRYGVGGPVVAIKTGAHVVPVAHNAGYFWPRQSLKIYPGTIDMVIGEPIQVDDVSPQALKKQVEQWIEGTVAELPKGPGRAAKAGMEFKKK